MSKLERIQAEIESLSEEEYSRLREWGFGFAGSPTGLIHRLVATD